MKPIRPSPSGEVAFMDAGGPSPLKVQISQEGHYKSGFLEAVKKGFVGNWWPAQDFKEREANSTVASSSMEWLLIRICRTSSGTVVLLPKH